MKRRFDIGGARRLIIDIDSICPTVMAVGIGSVNCSQYQLLVTPPQRNPMKTKNKTPYKVPSMEEIKNIEWNGLKVASTFSGCGGSCLGYRMAGYRVVWANEFIPAAQDSYKANHPNSILDTRDIRNVNADDILKATGLKRGEIDVFDGSPPCQAFSTAGKREKNWGKGKKYENGITQDNEDLFFEYVRLLNGLQPKVFIAENVSGLVKGTAKGYFKIILKQLKECGYNVSARVLDAQWLGVPQMRQRLIFVGVRKDLGVLPSHPKPLSYRYSVREALPDITKVMLRNGFTTSKPNKDYIDSTAPCVTASGASSYSQHYIESKSQKRKFTIAELKRIGAFPDDFILKGSYAQQWERVGNSVPPIMMYHISKHIRDNILQ